MSDKSMLGERIKERRKALGMTQAQLADRLHVTNKAVSKWETEDANPDISLLPALCEVLQISADELLNISSASDAVVAEPAPTPRAETNKMTAWDRCKYGFTVLGIAITAILTFFGLFSTLLAFNREQVADATGNANDQPMLIIFSTILMLVFSFLCVRLIKRLNVIHMTFALDRLSKLRQLAAENNMTLYHDLPPAKQKEYMRNYRKTTRPLFLLLFGCIALLALLFSLRWIIRWAWWIDMLFYLLGIGGTYGFCIILFFMRRSYFKSMAIYI